MILWLAQGKLSNSLSIGWDDNAQEHRFYNHQSDVTVSFPTPLFYDIRLKLVNEMQIAGIALWELGQMFPLYIDSF
jgi:spore germination protein YaaH